MNAPSTLLGGVWSPPIGGSLISRVSPVAVRARGDINPSGVSPVAVRDREDNPKAGVLEGAVSETVASCGSSVRSTDGPKGRFIGPVPEP
jgi:hypothetical protein